MKKRTYTITPEQERYRLEVLKLKPKHYQKKSKKENFSIFQKITREQYMSNCIYWIKEYEAGRVDIQRCLSAASNLKNYCEQIISEQRNPPIKQ